MEKQAKLLENFTREMKMLKIKRENQRKEDIKNLLKMYNLNGKQNDAQNNTQNNTQNGKQNEPEE